MMNELVKIVGALAWIVGLITVFVSPPLGVMLLIVAVLMSAVSVTRTRERRHQEIIDAAREDK